MRGFELLRFAFSMYMIAHFLYLIMDNLWNKYHDRVIVCLLFVIAFAARLLMNIWFIAVCTWVLLLQGGF